MNNNSFKKTRGVIIKNNFSSKVSDVVSFGNIFKSLFLFLHLSCTVNTCSTFHLFLTCLLTFFLSFLYILLTYFPSLFSFFPTFLIAFYLSEFFFFLCFFLLLFRTLSLLFFLWSILLLFCFLFGPCQPSVT